jgi:hypothetical protein
MSWTCCSTLWSTSTGLLERNKTRF